MSIHRNKFLSGTALALSVSFLSSCAPHNVNDNGMEERDSLVHAVENAKQKAAKATSPESNKKTLTSPPFFPEHHKEHNDRTSNFSKNVEEASENAKTHKGDTTNFLHDYFEPEEP